MNALLILLVLALTYAILFIGRRAKNLPPGPPTLPVLGNLHQIPRKGAHFQFTRWAKQYGGLYSLKLGTGTAVVLTDRRLVKELVDRKSAVYSARPGSYVADLISGGDHILLVRLAAVLCPVRSAVWCTNCWYRWLTELNGAPRGSYCMLRLWRRLLRASTCLYRRPRLGRCSGTIC